MRAAEFWDGQLKPIIAAHLDPRENGDSRAKKSFSLHHQRKVSFKDTADCILSAAGFSYRERADMAAGVAPAANIETTLKFRSPDVFLSTTSRFEGRENAKSKLEEDISIAQGGAIRSGYSYSVTQKRRAAQPAISLRTAVEAYPGSLRLLESLSGDAPQPEAGLVSGPVFAELVYSKAQVDLGNDTDAEFDLTLWYPSEATDRRRPAVVEISYSYDTEKGQVDGKVALRGVKLFAALRKELSAWIAPGSQSKTSRALPSGCHEN
ncbi:hypothetical protein [Bradyrhizobium sp. Ai1a-2]|uniref:hypothetical protein n=1 Tax=Bradyrhizobium sp. Ai1a-2 TaxID=196490 RepID=UPI0012692E85|nr:hypothetical protein [Bradyrhizobium sp. Ai1a-2]